MLPHLEVRSWRWRFTARPERAQVPDPEDPVIPACVRTSLSAATEVPRRERAHLRTRNQQVVDELVPRYHVDISIMGCKDLSARSGVPGASIPDANVSVGRAAGQDSRLRRAPLQVFHARLRNDSKSEPPASLAFPAASEGHRTVCHVDASPTAQVPASPGSHRCICPIQGERSPVRPTVRGAILGAGSHRASAVAARQPPWRHR